MCNDDDEIGESRENPCLKDISEAHLENKYDNLFINIIRSINERHNLNVAKYELLDVDYFEHPEAYAKYYRERKDGKIIYFIEMTKFDEHLYSDDPTFNDKHIDIFLESFGIQHKRTLAMYVFIILHEIGHIYQYTQYEKNLNDFASMNKAIYSINDLFYRASQMTYDQRRSRYSELQYEANPDTFAYQNFYSIWKKFNLDNF